MKTATAAFVAASLALTLFQACGGGGSGAPHRLAFTPGASGAPYHFALNPTSTGTTLVLDLYGPAGTSIQGLALFLTTDPAAAAWTSAGGEGTWSMPAGALDLGGPPRLYADKVSGNDLQVGLFQKAGAAALAGSQPIVTVALKLGPGAGKGRVTLQTTPGKRSFALNQDGTRSDLDLDLGTVSAE